MIAANGLHGYGNKRRNILEEFFARRWMSLFHGLLDRFGEGEQLTIEHQYYWAVCSFSKAEYSFDCLCYLHIQADLTCQETILTHTVSLGRLLSKSLDVDSP